MLCLANIMQRGINGALDAKRIQGGGASPDNMQDMMNACTALQTPVRR